MNPIASATKSEAVYIEVRRRILNGALAPGARLNQDALAPELGVSITPLREAVRRLEAEGLVRFEAHKTLIVTPLTRDELEEIYDVRVQLDPHAASLAAKAASDEALDEIDRLARLPLSGDPLQQVAANRGFHRAVYSRSGNALLTDILDGLWERTDRYRVILLSDAREVVEAGREHVVIAEAMRERDARRVARLISSHVLQARLLIEAALD
jgi:DNA-binding GntR family transcriptional regulator